MGQLHIHSVSRELWAAVAQQQLHEEETQDYVQAFDQVFDQDPSICSSICSSILSSIWLSIDPGLCSKSQSPMIIVH